MHHETTQARTELYEILVMELVNVLVLGVIVRDVLEMLARRHAVIHGIEAGRDRDDDSDHGKRIEKRRQDGSERREQQGQPDLRANVHQELRERKNKEIFEEIDAGDHEDQKQNHLELVARLLEHCSR